jgi:N-acetylmuramic acid 6-phosphate (MurNAc-6-P) etherase
MVELAAEVSAERATAALAAAGGEVKLAVLVARGLSAEEAAAALAAVDGNLRRALESLSGRPR